MKQKVFFLVLLLSMLLFPTVGYCREQVSGSDESTLQTYVQTQILQPMPTLGGDGPRLPEED